MSQMPVEANVVLTADNTQYDQAMQQSAGQSDAVAASIDKISGKLEQLSKSAGRKILGAGAIDVAAITAGTAAFASYEKQMSLLEAQAAGLNTTMSGSQRTMDTYARSVNNMRDSFGTSTRDAAMLTQQVAKLADGTQPITKLTTTFSEMANATGESATGLSTSVLNLQRVMGTPQRDAQRYADQLFTLSAGANTSATALADFTSQLAPVGRLLNINQTDMTGFATAFTKAGQDGFQAANVFNKMVSDIASATQSGGPSLAKYSNFVGMTMDQFKDLEGTDKILRIVDQITSQGPKAITDLNKLGLDGMRTVRAITGLAQSGGLEGAIEQARDSLGNGAVKRGSEASMKGISDEFNKLTEQSKQMAEAFGQSVAPAAERVVAVLGTMASAATALMSSPLGQLGGMLAGIAAPMALIAGTALMSAGKLAAFAGAMQVFRGGFATGYREQRVLNPAGQRAQIPNVRPDGTPTSWSQRAFYNVGAGYSRAIGAANDGQPNMLSRAAGRAMQAGGAGANLLAQSYARGTVTVPGMAGTGGVRSLPWLSGRFGMSETTGVSNYLRGQPIFSSPTLGGTLAAPFAAVGNAMGAGYRNQIVGTAARLTGQVGGEAAFRTRLGGAYTYADAQRMNERMNYMTRTPMAGLPMNDRIGLASDRVERISPTSRALGGLEREAMSASKGLGLMGRGVANLTTMMAASALGAGRVGAGLAGQAFSLVGGNYLLAGGLAAYGSYAGYKATTSDMDYTQTQRNANYLQPYQQIAGVTAPTAYDPSAGSFLTGNGAPTMAQAGEITQAEANSTKSSNYTYTNELVKDADSISSAVAGVSSQWDTIKNDPTAINALSLDFAARFGQGPGQEAISGMLSGDAFDMGSEARGDLVMQAMTSERKGFWDTVLNRRSGSVATERLNEVFSSIGDTTAFIRSTEGEQAANEFNASEMSTLFDQINQAREDRPGVGFSKEVDTVAVQSLAENLFGEKDLATSGDADKIAANMRYNYAQDSDWGLEQAIRQSAENQEWGSFFPTEERLQNALEYRGLDPTLRGEAAGDALADDMFNPDLPETERNRNSVEERVALISPEASDFINSPNVKKLVEKGAEMRPDLLYQSTAKEYQDFIGQGLSPQQIITETNRIRATVRNDDADESILASNVGAQAQQAAEIQMQGLSRPEQFEAQTELIRSQMRVEPRTDQQYAEREQNIQNFMGAVSDQAEYFRSALLQQEQFDLQQSRASEDFYTQLGRMEEQYNLSRSRAQYDFNLSRAQQEEDYQRQRRHAEFDYDLQRERGQENFNRQLRRQQRDFNLSRKRQEEDYQHSVRLMIEQTAQSTYNIYERIRVQQTSSADYLLYNATDQIEEMRKQAENLNKVRRMGLSDDAIQQLGFNQSDNAQQLSRFVADSQENPETIQKMNRAVKQRLAAARELATDESSKEWQEFQRQYRLSRRRAMEDFEKSVARARKDFGIQMSQMEEDFRRSMDRQAESYEIARDRQAKAFRLTMDRGAEDYARSVDYMTTDFEKSMNRAQENLDMMSRSISGNLKQIFTRASRELRGEIGKQADMSMENFSDLESSLDKTGINIMKRMSAIFGFDYTPPKGGPGGGGGKNKGPIDAAPGTPGGPKKTAYAGGVLEATRSVGRDNVEFYSKDHGSLSLAGGEAIMVPEWVDAQGGPHAIREMNDAARYGRLMPSKHNGDGSSFAEGGIWHPGPRSTYAGHSGSLDYIVDINSPGGTGTPVRAFLDGQITTVADLGGSSYGKYIKMNHPAAGLQTLYAHLSEQLVSVGQRVARGFMIGREGSTGRSSGPHLHFEIGGGQSAIQAAGSGTTGGTGAPPTIDMALKDIYDGVEKASEGVKLNGGLFERGFWSKKINKMARMALEERGIDPNQSPAQDSNFDAPPGDLSQNQKIVRQEMLKEGFPASQWPALYELIMRESGFNNVAQNPNSTAYGMFQFLDSTWAGYGGPKTSDPRAQAIYGMNYIRARYGDPAGAVAFHDRNNWYGDGAIFAGGAQQIGVGERGPEMVLPLNDRGAEFITEIIGRSAVGREANCGHDNYMPKITHSQNTYNVDRSTNFTGAITVQANNPGEMLQELKQRQRVMALSQPSLGGTR